MSDVTPTFTGEIQMRRWSDSSTQGVQVTFGLPYSDDLEPLKAKAGRRFYAVLVELGDDEMPVPPAPRKDTRGPLCREACDLCAMLEFQEWMCSRGMAVKTVDDAKRYLCGALGIESRKELDQNANAVGIFISQFRIPFMRYMASRKKAA